MPVLHAIILGCIQGFTEVLPISSSAHLFIFPWLFKWHYQGLSFDVALHMGTALAFIIYFFKDWLEIISSAFKKGKDRSNLFFYIAAGTIPAAFAGLLLEKKAEIVFRSPLLIAGMLAAFAVILWLADNFGRKEKPIEQVGLKSAIQIGIAQAIAIIPGVSRSGITMTAGLFIGFSRQAAARFSFLLATPVIVAAGVLKLSRLHSTDLTMSFWVGILFSTLSGFVGLYFLLGFIKKYSLNIFVYYRIVLAAVILAMHYLYLP